MAEDSLAPADPLMTELLGPPAPWRPGGPSAGAGIKKVSYTHDSMINLIIANPVIDQNQLAAHYGYTPAWVSQIIASDAFQTRLAERKDELIDPTIRATIEENFKGLVVRSLAILKEKLNRPTSAIPDNLALRTLELSSRALGYGARLEAPPAPSADGRLEELGERLVGLLERKKAERSITIDAQEITVVPS